MVPEDWAHRHIGLLLVRQYYALDGSDSLSSAFSRFRSRWFYLFSHAGNQLQGSHFNDTVEIKVASRTV